MLFKPKLLMMFGLLWKEEEGYGQRWTRKLFEKSENRNPKMFVLIPLSQI
jgi:hypothetical protein